MNICLLSGSVEIHTSKPFFGGTSQIVNVKKTRMKVRMWWWYRDRGCD
jgi:hypothetical protein